MPLGTEVGLGQGHNVLDGDPAPPPQKEGTAAPHFSAHVYSGYAGGWIKMPLGMEVSLVLCHIALELPSSERGTAAPHFSAHVYCGPGDIVLDGGPSSA